VYRRTALVGKGTTGQSLSIVERVEAPSRGQAAGGEEPLTNAEPRACVPRGLPNAYPTLHGPAHHLSHFALLFGTIEGGQRSRARDTKAPPTPPL